MASPSGYTRVSGSWKKFLDIQYKVAGVWKKILFGYQKVSGNWKLIHRLVTVAGDVLLDIVGVPSTAEVGYRINSSGKEQSYEGLGVSYSDIGDWLEKGSAGDYDCQLVVNSGTAPAGSSTGVWLNCGTSRAWTLTATSYTDKTNSCTIKIRHSASGVELASATVSMYAASIFVK